MKEARFHPSFEKDIYRCKKRGLDTDKLFSIIELLKKGQILPPSAKPHVLKGKWKGLWECHVSSNWLLIYDIAESYVYFLTTGTHADLFGK